MPDEPWFHNKNAKEQGYIIHGLSDGKVVVYAKNRVGILYALATFVQIPAIENEFEIKDYPDFRYRGNKWLIWAETAILSFDFGDGLEEMRARVLRGLDLCLKYKINMLDFDGYGLGVDRFAGYREFMRFCTKEARKRGIYLINGAYTMGYGLAGFSFGKHYGNAYQNRTSYPNGESYECLGTFVWPNNYKGEPYVIAREHGTCISNDELTEQKVEELRNYVKETGIGGLYLHNMDSFLVHEVLWQSRCETCKKRWPNDDIFAKDGMAGAFAYFFDKINGALKGISFDDYDSSRDLLLMNIAPGYLWYYVPDEQVDKAVKFWRKVTDFMEVRANVFPTFRELYHNMDDNKERIPDVLAKQWRDDMDFAIVNFNGSDGYHSDKLFFISSIFNYMFRGAQAILTCNGHFLQEPLAVFNAEYMWNSENSAFYNLPDRPKDYESFLKLYFECQRTEFRPEEIYGEGGMLDVICEKLYGASGKTMANMFKLCGENYECPIPYLCNYEIQTNGSRTLLPYRWDGDLKPKDIEKLVPSFAEMARLTEEAKALLEAEKTDNYDIISYRKMLVVSEPVVRLWHQYLTIYEALDKAFREEKEPDETLMMLIDECIAETAKLKEWYDSQDFVSVEAMKGALCKAEEMYQLLDYNLNLMKKSIITKKRIPDDREILTEGVWW